MKLYQVELLNYKRFRGRQKINLDEKTIAIVGQNESGKTSFLEALTYIESVDESNYENIISPGEKECYVKATFQLEEYDYDAWQALDEIRPNSLPAKAPQKYVVKVSFSPSGALSEKLFLKKEAFIESGGQEIYEIEDQETLRMLLGAFEESRPKFLLYTDPDKTLLPRYKLLESIDSKTNDHAPNQALENLLALGETSINDALEAARSSQTTRTAYQNRINRNLNGYLKAWKQEKIKINVEIRGEYLEISAKNMNDDGEDNLYSLAERSKGFISFLTLISFLKAQGKDYTDEEQADETLDPARLEVPTAMLLIDEAELHLHQNAQADFVNFLETQKLTAGVIYTTHSPACLPSDLGRGIRSIKSLPTGDSKIVDFWTAGAGYSPLLFLMGAGASAFSSLRKALLVEGPSDMILFPTLFREATGNDKLKFQIAPGLSLQDKDIETISRAERAVVLTDSDSEGDQYFKKLTKAGINQKFILTISDYAEGAVDLEALIEPHTYVDAINYVANAHNDNPPTYSIEDLAVNNRSKGVKEWCSAQGIGELSKVEVARVLAERGKNSRIIDSKYIGGLDALHTKILELLTEQGVNNNDL